MIRNLIFAFLSLAGVASPAQQIDYEEYDLANGLHVILHEDKSAPVVVTSVMYHVGAKDERPDRTGFAHFFEHLLFEGTEHIARNEWFKIVTANGGQNNANTTDDRTYYYEVFPSNNLELGLWMESERMLHPVINQIGVDTQNEVVKEEKRLRIDNRPYGNILKAIKEKLFTKHPYRWTTIGEMEHLDAATLDEFLAFFDKFYVPNNAVLVVAGDIEKKETKRLIERYFGSIPRGEDVVRNVYKEDPITQPIEATWEDPNVQIPMYAAAYRTPSMKERDAYVLDMISTILTGGKTSRLYKKMVDEDKKALDVGAFNNSQEDYGMYIIYSLPMDGVSKEEIINAYDEQIKELQTNLISDKEFQTLRNKFENSFVNSNASIQAVADNLATSYLLYNDTSLVNRSIEILKSITKEEIKEVANKYLNPNQRLILDYIPEKSTASK